MSCPSHVMGNTTPTLHSSFDSRVTDTTNLTSCHTLREFLVWAETHVCTLPAITPNCWRSAVRRRRGVSSVQLWADSGGTATALPTAGVGNAVPLSRRSPPRSCYHYIYIPRCFIGPPCLTSTFTLGLLLLTLTHLTPRCMLFLTAGKMWEVRGRKWSV